MMHRASAPHPKPPKSNISNVERYFLEDSIKLFDPPAADCQSALLSPARLPIGIGASGQAGHTCPIRVHDINLVVAISIRGEGDPLSIWRPTRAEVIPSIRELDQSRSIDVDHVNVMVASGSRIKNQ